MSYTLSGQKPGALDPVQVIPIAGDYDPLPAIQSAMVAPVFEPLGTAPASLVDGSGRDVDADELLSMVTSSLHSQVNVTVNDEIKEIYQQALVHFDQTNPRLIEEAFVVQAAMQQKLPAPSTRVLYSVKSDILPAAKSLLAGGDPNLFFASIAYLYAPATLGFWFQDAAAFDEFKVWFEQQIAAMSGVLPVETITLADRFVQQYTIKGEIADGLVLRKNDADALEEFSFARVLVSLLMQYELDQRKRLAATPGSVTSGVLPFAASELFLPRTVVFANIEAHSRASEKKVDSAWKLINASLAMPVKIVSNRALSKLTALPRSVAKASSQAAYGRAKTAQGRSAAVKFRKQAPTRIDIVSGVVRALKRMKKVAQSQNPLKQVKHSFAKANRRSPDDYNLAGKVVSTVYLPDLHVYLDCSGSISERNYQGSVIELIKLAKKLNVNIYFNSFADTVSQEVLLHTAGKSVQQIWHEFRRIPKVTGGTDFHQVWDYVMAKPARVRRMSLMITDFEYTPPTRNIVHPPNFYYAPVAEMDWDRVTRYAERFSKSMRHIEPALARRIIGVFR